MIVPFHRRIRPSAGGKRLAEAEERERCVLCRRLMDIPKGVPLAVRKGYIEGAGQLCENCFRELYKTGERGSMED